MDQFALLKLMYSFRIGLGHIVDLVVEANQEETACHGIVRYSSLLVKGVRVYKDICPCVHTAETKMM